MDASKGFGDDGPEAEIARAENGMFPARALTIVVSAHDEKIFFTVLHSTLVEGFVDTAESELADFWDVAAER